MVPPTGRGPSIQLPETMGTFFIQITTALLSSLAIFQLPEQPAPSGTVLGPGRDKMSDKSLLKEYLLLDREPKDVFPSFPTEKGETLAPSSGSILTCGEGDEADLGGGLTRLLPWGCKNNNDCWGEEILL